MPYPRTSYIDLPQWFHQFTTYCLQPSAFFLHAGFFVAAVLLGIARYGHAVPVIATLLMTLWSIGFMLHGIVIYRTGSSVDNPPHKPQDGIVKTAVFSSVISAVMWVMWTLATDARDASPWHLSIWLTLVAAAISTIIMGKRALYNHWFKTYTDNASLLRTQN